MEQPVETFSNNINGYINLLEFAKKKKLKVLFMFHQVQLMEIQNL